MHACITCSMRAHGRPSYVRRRRRSRARSQMYYQPLHPPRAATTNPAHRSDTESTRMSRMPRQLRESQGHVNLSEKIGRAARRRRAGGMHHFHRSNLIYSTMFEPVIVVATASATVDQPMTCDAHKRKCTAHANRVSRRHRNAFGVTTPSVGFGRRVLLKDGPGAVENL